MPIIVKLPRAKSDLVEIWDYIADDSEARADGFIETIDRRFQTLAGRANMGRSRDELAEGLRSFSVGLYKSSCWLRRSSTLERNLNNGFGSSPSGSGMC